MNHLQHLPFLTNIHQFFDYLSHDTLNKMETKQEKANLHILADNDPPVLFIQPVGRVNSR
jgi:hypothetical protein